MAKPGRNEPCPCGSGKKYKNCCASAVKPDTRDLEGTAIGLSRDDYEEGLSLLSDYFDEFIGSDKDGEELTAQAAWFDLLYEPGTDKGVPEELFLPWLYFDIRFGKSEWTLCERFLKSPTASRLSAENREAVRQMSMSYQAFYETLASEPGILIYKELGTGKEWKITITDEEITDDFEEGDLIYVRLVGTPDNAFMFDVPWSVDNKLTEDIEILYLARWDEAKAEAAGTLSEEHAFKEFNKGLSSFWTGYINGQVQFGNDDLGAIQLLNTEGNILRFCEVTFTINQEADLLKRFSEAEDFDYHEDDDLWIWNGQSEEDHNRRMVSELYAPPDLADLSIKGNRLVGETNSRERADRLKNRIEQIAGTTASFEKVTATDVDSGDSDSHPKQPKKKKKR
jgi:hypothetical protein